MTTRNAVRLDDPVVAWTARDNLQAQILAAQLDDAGIAAFVVEDTSTAGVTSLCLRNNIHQPQVYVDRRQQNAAIEIIRQLLSADGSTVESRDFCCHCGAGFQGAADTCSACGALIEVDDDQPAAPVETSFSTSMNAFFRRSRKWCAMANILPIVGMLLFAVIGVVLKLASAIFRP